MGKRAFTLIEIIIAVSIVVGLFLAMIIVLNPITQLAKGRNAQRWSDVNIVLNAIGQNAADNKGSFSCASGAVPTTTVPTMAAGTSSSYYDIASCLVPTYLASLPYDPSTSSAKWVSVSNYNTGYTITANSTTARITIAAPLAELSSTISVTR